MPYKPKHPCGMTGCPELTDKRFCPKHEKQNDKIYNTYYRDKGADKFYQSDAWRRLREQKLYEQPLCEECLKSKRFVNARMVDHIIPIKQGGGSLDITNLQSLCWSCHSRKSSLEGSRWGKK